MLFQFVVESFSNAIESYFELPTALSSPQSMSSEENNKREFPRQEIAQGSQGIKQYR